VNMHELVVGSSDFRVVVARTEKDRVRGLSGQVMLTGDRGMLFVFETKARHEFWMKDMHFPLDFIWIAGDRVLDITENVPVYDAQGKISRVRPSVEVDKVLEVKAGTVKRNGIRIGDVVVMDII